MQDAKSGDMYVRDRSLEQKYHHLQDVNRKMTESYMALDKEYKGLLADHMEEISDAEEWKARHDDMLREVNKPAIGCEDARIRVLAEEECDGRDYDAVTKGVISLINLLRR